MKTRVGILYGGKSPEHNVSLSTAMAVMNAMDKNKFDVIPIYITTEGQWIKGERLTGTITEVKQLQFQSDAKAMIPVALNQVPVLADDKNQHPSEMDDNKESETAIDVIFPLLHGPNGEDGTVQGLLEILNIPYVGNGVLASAVGMDKVVMKNLFAQAGLRQAKYVAFTKRDWSKDEEAAYDQVERKLGYPCFVKPANAGSSVGITKCKQRADLKTAFIEAFKYDRKIIVEEAIVGREIEIGVIGNDEPICSVVGEIIPKKEFYDYQAKYEDGNTELIIPAQVTEEQYETIKQMAITAFKALDLSGLVRADFFLAEDGTVYINEINTMPGFTPYSMFPLLWKHSGVSYPELIERLIQLAIERHEEKQTITYTFEK
ncbi:D-alanine--D-alanine ligase [Saccharococcus caldoxylosilyticus]|jgi:D-alanine-D-alanine ligase|uniref:D-alanine--D-alanine ligase n=2 Tax=Saccharococcus caldoxylosilyticus TaxID=81408 RepID=A0A023DF92_9BACL|nr:D-alanine--D-alanine ligase [Parageobacillus caldoxylosilyticus]OQP02525.1 D-alanine--D-alanine ligase A [Geobacillus sp. 44B]KYD04487.1 D-alanine--D-alanine ligase [Parageobacillus caldoxylosilyticus]MBB3853086.1 D-alanine-D-alanine ligase [Parageobacillus caldoxylosilyticus]QNU38512.1 D-alanine--D-alanine ligase [Geobacillus sp. 44B]QXJ38218.1 D-alanine--D-alanine ligase [Parageobacillus caldoxylosilyticus]